MAQSGGGIRQQISLVGDAEVKAAFDRIGASGEQAFTKIKTAAGTAPSSLNRVSQESHKVELGLFRLVGELTQTTQKMQFMSEAAGGLLGGLTGLAAFELGTRLFGQLGQGLDRLNDIRKTAANLELDPDAIKGFGEAMKNAGLQSSDASSSLSQFAGVVADAQKDVQQLGNNLVPTVSVMKGADGAANNAVSGISTLRGALNDGKGSARQFVQVMKGEVIQGLNSTGDAFEKAGADIKNFKGAPDNVIKSMEAVAARVVALGKNIRPDVLKGLQEAFKIDDAEAFLRLMNEINAKGFKGLAESAKDLPPTKAQIDALQEYNKATSDLKNQWSTDWENISINSVGLLTKGSSLALSGLEALGRAEHAVVDGIKLNFTTMTRDVTAEWNRLSSAFGESGLLNGAISVFDSIGQALASRLEIMKAAIAAFGQAEDTGSLWTLLETGWTQTLQRLTDSLNEWLSTATDIFTSLGTRIQDALSSAFNWISDKINSLSDSLSSLFNSVGTASGASGGNLEGFASGGYVSGPGTGTSDSIPAWLSNGEYVMRASAVEHWGPRFMASLNALRNPFAGFSMGGLVDAMSAPLVPRSATRFASGGLVAAAPVGGTPVHLHFPSGASVPLTADSAVIAVLNREARKAGMLSGGKPPVRF